MNQFERDKFYVIAVISNPVRYESRYSLYRDFLQRMKEQNVKVITVEAAFADRPFEVTSAGDPMAIQLRGTDELWLKENLINVGINRLYTIAPDFKYCAWIDADVSFVRPDWVDETIHQLQHHQVVQLFQNAIDLGPNGEIIQNHTGFCYQYLEGKPFYLKNGKAYGEFWHSGFAWAATREGLEGMADPATGHPLIERAILGAADHHMACALIGKADSSLPGNVHPSYAKMVKDYEERVLRNIKMNVGFVSGTIFHYWHGKKKDRKYQERWAIVSGNKVDVNQDIKMMPNGLLALTGNKVKLRDDLRSYFRARNEDSVDLV